MRKLFVFAGILALTVPLLADQQAPAAGRQGGQQGARAAAAAAATRRRSVRSTRSARKCKRPPSPTGPAPRLPDGTIDLNGLWSGGGPVGSIAQGLKQGETLPLLPAAQAIDRRSRHS